MQFIMSVNYFSTKMSVCSQHQVFPAYFNHLCSFTIPGCDCWFCSTLISGEHGHLGWPTLLRGAVELGRFLSRKPPPSPPLPQLLLASCWKAFFSLLSSASHSSPCQHLEHRCSALCLPLGTSHRGSRRGNNKLLLQRTFLSNTIIVYSKKNTTSVLPRVGAAVKLAADVTCAFAWIVPAPDMDAGRSNGATKWHLLDHHRVKSHAVSKFLRQAGAPSAGWLGEEPVGSPTVFTTTGEAISQDEWLVSAGEMILFALTLCHFAVYRYHREKWH